MTEIDTGSSTRGEQLRLVRMRRIARVRRRVAATSLVGFALTWGVIAGAGAKGATATTATRSATTTTSSATQDGSGVSATQDDSDFGAPSPVTTQQS